MTDPEAPPVHPIEAQSYRILAQRLDLQAFRPDLRPLVARVVHATADEDLGRSLRASPGALAAGRAALARGAPVLCDVEMVRAGLGDLPTRCYLAQATAGPGGWPTRSARAVELAAKEHPQGALVVVGCAPTALARWLDLLEAGQVHPAVIVGLPVGYVGAAEQKARLGELAEAGLVEAIWNIGARGGSAAACAVVRALHRLNQGIEQVPEGLR